MAKAIRDQVSTEGRVEGLAGTLRIGDSIILIKTAVKEGEKSSVVADQPMKGTYMERLQDGKPFNYGTGNTSAVIRWRSEGDKLVIETKTLYTNFLKSRLRYNAAMAHHGIFPIQISYILSISLMSGILMRENHD